MVMTGQPSKLPGLLKPRLTKTPRARKPTLTIARTANSGLTALQVSARALGVVVLATMINAACGVRLADSNLDCAGLICRQKQAVDSDAQLVQLLKSRVSTIYNDALGLGRGSAGSLFKSGTKTNPLGWRVLLEDVGNGHLNNNDDDRDTGVSQQDHDTNHLSQFYQPKKQSLAHEKFAREDSQIPPSGQGLGVPEFSMNLIYPKSAGKENLRAGAVKRQQGWHTQYGKRSSRGNNGNPREDEGKIVPHLTAELEPTTRAETSLSEPQTTGNLLIPQAALDFLFLSKFLSPSQKERLAMKLGKLLHDMAQEDRQAEREVHRNSIWLEHAQPSQISVKAVDGGGTSLYDSAPYRSEKTGRVFFDSNEDPQMKKRQQGWHTRYGKRDSDSRPLF